jgi:hypothetical protein
MPVKETFTQGSGASCKNGQGFSRENSRLFFYFRAPSATTGPPAKDTEKFLKRWFRNKTMSNLFCADNGQNAPGPQGQPAAPPQKKSRRPWGWMAAWTLLCGSLIGFSYMQDRDDARRAEARRVTDEIFLRDLAASHKRIQRTIAMDMIQTQLYFNLAACDAKAPAPRTFERFGIAPGGTASVTTEKVKFKSAADCEAAAMEDRLDDMMGVSLHFAAGAANVPQPGLRQPRSGETGQHRPQGPAG